jgi:hypothetical protein
MSIEPGLVVVPGKLLNKLDGIWADHNPGKFTAVTRKTTYCNV